MGCDRSRPQHLLLFPSESSRASAFSCSLTLTPFPLYVSVSVCLQGSTPLHNAGKWGKLKATQMLVDQEADIHVTNNAGKTPLQLAQEYQQNQWQEVVELLRSKAAEGSE